MSVSYGGQAVLEGVMMRGPSCWAVAVRTPAGGIEEVVQDVNSPMKRHRIWRLPVIRGVIALGESLAIGFRALAISANVAAREEDDEGNVVTEISRGQIIFSFAIAIGFALMLFKVGPALLTSWLPVEDTGSFVVVEGLIRVAVFIAYIGLIGLLPDLRRVFQYHGAEHKTINALEAGSELTPERVQKFSLIHPRCGTAFLLWVMVIGIFVFAFIGRPVWYWLIASRILLLPVIAGLAYELIRYAGKHQDNRVLMTLLAPGLWLQRLTTREPTLDQVEVSIRAIEEVRRREAEESPAEQADDRKVEVMAGSAMPSRSSHATSGAMRRPRSRSSDPELLFAHEERGSITRRSTDAAHRPGGRRVLGWKPRTRHRRAHRRNVPRVRGARLLAPCADRRRARREDEPRGAPRRGARRLLHDVARRRADGRGHPAGSPRRALSDHDGRGRGPRASDRPLRAGGPGAVPGIDGSQLDAAVEAAHQGCSFSSLLRDAGVGIDITSTLEGGD